MLNASLTAYHLDALNFNSVYFLPQNMTFIVMKKERRSKYAVVSIALTCIHSALTANKIMKILAIKWE